jgi:hypothetical protein
MGDPCKFEDKIIKILEDGSATRILVETMRKEINGAVRETKEHIKGGFQRRIASWGVITTLGIFILGIAYNNAIKFGVMQNEVSTHKEEMKQIKEQIYDLNYVRGKAEAKSTEYE